MAKTKASSPTRLVRDRIKTLQRRRHFLATEMGDADTQVAREVIQEHMGATEEELRQNEEKIAGMTAAKARG